MFLVDVHYGIVELFVPFDVICSPCKTAIFVGYCPPLLSTVPCHNLELYQMFIYIEIKKKPQV